jgi:hypothetical protein
MARRPYDGRGSPDTRIGGDAVQEYEDRLAAEDAKVESLGEMLKRRKAMMRKVRDGR